MLNAILKVVGISLVTVILCAGIVLMTRVNAFRQTAQVPPHAWFEHPTWDIAAPAIDQWCANPTGPRSAGEILMLPVRKTPTQWEVACPAHLSLEAALKRAQPADVLFEIEAGAPEDLDNFVDIVTNSSVKRVGVHAASQRAARHLRKKEPGWVFAADDPSVLRLHMFTAMYLEPAIDFWPDFVLADAGDQNGFNAREVTELHRRLKRIVWVDRTRQPDYPVDGRVRY